VDGTDKRTSLLHEFTLVKRFAAKFSEWKLMEKEQKIELRPLYIMRTKYSGESTIKLFTVVINSNNIECLSL
jgi:hypothetical protein